jgi:signal transduction histidine kinase
MKIQMVGDLVVLTILLNLSGGIENPLVFSYVIHVIIASLLFKGRGIFHIACLACVLFTAMVAGEHFGWLPHHHLPMMSEATHEISFILLHLVSFWLVILFAAYVGARIMRHNRVIKDELVARQQDLIQADKAKNDFFRYVTHEVKSPISTAQSALEAARMLGGDTLPEKVDDLLQRAARRLEQATGMVKNLADLTRGGDLKEENLTTVNLNELLTRVAEGFGDLATGRSIDIEILLPDRPVKMKTSAGRVEAIAANIIGNAVRYCREGKNVSVQLLDTGDVVHLIVEDEGIGIAEEDQEKIFEEFYRTTAARETTDLGTGLGLAIVKKYVADLGGRIELHSDPGSGTTFTIVLPRRSRAQLPSAGEDGP